MWSEFVENPQAINEFFIAPPRLEGVEIISVTIDRDGPTATIHLGLKGQPDRIPKHKRIEANAVSLVLQLLAVKDITVDGWGTENQANVDVERQGEGDIGVRINGSTMRFLCKCQFVRIVHVRPYIRTEN